MSKAASTLSKGVGKLIKGGTEKQNLFPADPKDFNPKGLTRKDYNTKNGQIYKWFNDKGKAVYEWDEDLANGSHYHKIGSDGNTRIPDYNGNTHFKPFDSID